MEKRDVGYVIAYVLSFLFVAIIGISFSVFRDQNQRVEVKKIAVASEEGITIKSGSKTGSSLNLVVKSPRVGAKPVSGELDTQTDIPFTVNDQVGSEGAYAKFEVVSDVAFEIYLKSVNGVPEEDLDNVKISVDGSEKKPFSAKDINSVVAKRDANAKNKKFTVLVWLDQHVSKKIVGSRIEIYLSILPRN